MSNLSNILASIGKDKYIHFGVCLVLTLVIYAVASIWMGPAAVARDRRRGESSSLCFLSNPIISESV